MRYVHFVLAATPAPAASHWGLLDGETIHPLADAPWRLPAAVRAQPGTAPALHLSDVQLLAPAEPRKIVCVGRNYAEHAAEMGHDVPAEPLLFLKPTTALLAPGAPVVHPALSRRVDHEAELAVVIGEVLHGGRFLSEEEALRCVFGYTIANDVTARDLQKSDGQWSRAKGFDTFCPLGPWLDSSFDPAQRGVRCLVNGQLRQNGNTAQLFFSVARILSHISQAMRLEPGDLILTGTPAGVGPVQPGDTMVVEIDGLGSLHNPVIDESALRLRR